MFVLNPTEHAHVHFDSLRIVLEKVTFNYLNGENLIIQWF